MHTHLKAAALGAVMLLGLFSARPAAAQTALLNPSCNGGVGGVVGTIQTSGSGNGQACTPDANNASFSSPSTLTVGGTALTVPVRDLDAECTAAGTATVTFLNGNSVVWSVAVGSQDKPWQATGVSSVSGATCTFYGFAK